MKVNCKEHRRYKEKFTDPALSVIFLVADFLSELEKSKSISDSGESPILQKNFSKWDEIFFGYTFGYFQSDKKMTFI